MTSLLFLYAFAFTLGVVMLLGCSHEPRTGVADHPGPVRGGATSKLLQGAQIPGGLRRRCR
jgi:hypothetical protein